MTTSWNLLICDKEAKGTSIDRREAGHWHVASVLFRVVEPVLMRKYLSRYNVAMVLRTMGGRSCAFSGPAEERSCCRRRLVSGVRGDR